MFTKKIKVLRSHGKQYIPDLFNVTLPHIFRGRVELQHGIPDDLAEEVRELCPTGAIGREPFSLDMGRCLFCGECARRAPDYIHFTNDYKMASNVRENLVVTADSPKEVLFDPTRVRKEVCKLYGQALKLREVSAGGDNSVEMELNASLNVNFDLGRYGVDFVASPRHADGVVVTGPVSENMSEALNICYESIAEPKVVVMVGCDAISGGLFADSRAVDRSFLESVEVDLWIPGNPTHPMAFIDGVLTLLNGGVRRKSKR